MIRDRNLQIVAVVALAIGLGLAYIRRDDRAEDRHRSEEIAQRNEASGYKGIIMGRVRRSDGSPAAGLTVQARLTSEAIYLRRPNRPQGHGFALTDAQGRYRIHGLNPYGVEVFAQNDGKSLIEDASRVVKLKGLLDLTARDIDFTLTAAPEITVRVRDAQSGTPVKGIKVAAGRPGFGTGEPLGATDERGEFRFRAPHRETNIQLKHDRQGDGPNVGAAPGYHFLRQIAFTSAADVKDVLWEVRTYSDEPKRNATIFRGMVTDLVGKPVPGAQGTVLRGTNRIRFVTDRKGAFSLQTHRMQISEVGHWNGRQKKGIRFEVEKGDLFAVHYATPEETWTTIPIRLSRGGMRPSVTGQVVGVNGPPIAGVPIHYSESFLDIEAFAQENAGSSDANGRFTIAGLSPDAYYQFRFGKPAQNGNDFGFGITKVPEVTFMQGWLRLKAGERRDLGRVVVVRTDKALGGRMMTGSGRVPRGPLMISIKGKHTEASTRMGPDGSFRFDHVPGERLNLLVVRPNDPEGQSFSYDPNKPGVAVRGGDEALTIKVP